MGLPSYPRRIASPTMRYLLACLALSTVALSTGCQDRQNMRAVPNREGRSGGDGSQKLGDQVNAPVAGPTERYYTMEAGDTSYSVAKKFNTTKEWLIKRNEVTDTTQFKTGKTLIVPGSK